MDYTKVDEILEEIETYLTVPSEDKINSGLREIRFDKDFSDRLKQLFEKKFADVQNDAALKVARLMYKDQTFEN